LSRKYTVTLISRKSENPARRNEEHEERSEKTFVFFVYSCWTLIRALHLSPKVKVKTFSVLTGIPSRVAGLKTHWLAAAAAAGRSIMGPLMAVALMTRPDSEMTTCTSTFPVAPIALAAGG